MKGLVVLQAVDAIASQQVNTCIEPTSTDIRKSTSEGGRGGGGEGAEDAHRHTHA